MLGIAALAAAVLGAVGVLNYQPFRSAGGASGVTGDGVSERGEFLGPDGRSLTAYDVTAGSGSTFSFWFTVHNDGPFGATLTGIGPGPGAGNGFPIVRVMSNPALRDAKVRRFHEMSVPPGEAVDIQVTMKVAQCPPAGKRITFAEMPVTFRLLGLTRHTSLPLPETLTVRAGPGCP